MGTCRELTCPHHGPTNRQALIVYRGVSPFHEAPLTALHDYCPLGDPECVWHEAWDTLEELNEAKLRHVRDDHGEADPEDAILVARIRSRLSSRRISW